MGLFDGFQGGEKTAVMSMYDAIKAELDRHEWNYEESEESGENRRERYIYMRNELENDEPVTVVIAIREYDHADGLSRSRSTTSPISRRTATARRCLRRSTRGTVSSAMRNSAWIAIRMWWSILIFRLIFMREPFSRRASCQ